MSTEEDLHTEEDEDSGALNAGFETHHDDVNLVMDGGLDKNVFTKSVITGRKLTKQRFWALIRVRKVLEFSIFLML